jgi:cyclophilin family peptidyl-prolyl cis-trans isomerase
MRALLLILLALIWAEPGHASVLVRFETPLGSFDVELYDDVSPGHVENFLRYLRDGRYAQSFVHRNARIRLVAGQPTVPFVIQGGGFTFDPDLGPFVFNQGLRAVPTHPVIENDYFLSNTRGTVAMARGSQVTSATSQWFINLRDNGGAPAFLDTQNEGFTVFGRVVDPGMEIVDDIAAVTRWNAESSVHPAMDELPLIAFVQNTPIGPQHIVYTTITEVPEPGVAALRAGALSCVLLLARLTTRRRGAAPRPRGAASRGSCPGRAAGRSSGCSRSPAARPPGT